MSLKAILLDLAAQALDVDVDQPGVAGVAVAPDLLEEDLTGEDLPRLAGERHEEVELQRRERQRAAVALDRVAGDVDLQVADLELLGLGLVARGAAGPGPGRSAPAA